VRTFLDCIPCFVRQGLEAARHATEDPVVHERIVRDVLRMAAELDLARPPPFVGQLIHRRLRELLRVSDPYLEAKRAANRMAMDALPELAEAVRAASDPLVVAARLAIAANAIDMGVSTALTDAQVHAALHTSQRGPYCGDDDEFRRMAEDARDILYLADNAGEIAVDRLLVEVLGPERVTVAVRGGPVLNDATLDDAREVGMHELVELVDNGSDAPGTILADCSTSFQERFARADVVLAKGQGNYETLGDVDKKLAFLFKVKCPLVSDHVGVPLGTHALVCRRGRA
jgi:uncharacterized protein with ATP-grasp and redox domains